MDKKAEKDASKLANFILNNMSISEALHILAKKSQEVAEEMIKNNINHSEYKATLLKNENKENKSSTSILDKILLWFKNSTSKNETKVDETNIEQKKEEKTIESPKTILQNAPKQTLKNKPYIRTGFATKKRSK